MQWVNTQTPPSPSPPPSQVSSALDVIFFVREICETHPSLRPSILERLRDTFSSIRASRVVSGVRTREHCQKTVCMLT